MKTKSVKFSPNTLYYSHCIAHNCIQTNNGHFYQPDGRSSIAKQSFLLVSAKLSKVNTVNTSNNIQLAASKSKLQHIQRVI